MRTTIAKMIMGGFLGVLLVMSSCTKDYVMPPPPLDPTDTIYYSLDMQPFFDAKCINCHGGASPNLEHPGSYDNLIGGGYVDVANPANSSLYIAINVGGSMESYATPEERAMTLAWIEQGALNN